MCEKVRDDLKVVPYERFNRPTFIIVGRGRPSGRPAYDPPYRGEQPEVGGELQLAARRRVRRPDARDASLEFLVRQHGELRRIRAIDDAGRERLARARRRLDAIRLERFGP